jgi:predicted DNA binding CopG/RHH family protein
MNKKRDPDYDKYLDDDVELWESKQLGASAEHAKLASPEDDQALDDDLGLVPISLRLQKELVGKLKILAKQEGLGYQTYIRQILTRYVRQQVEQSKRETA